MFLKELVHPKPPVNLKQTFLITDTDIVVNKEAHIVNDVVIKVSLYYPFLDGDEEYIANIPVPFKLDGLDKYICR